MKYLSLLSLICITLFYTSCEEDFVLTKKEFSPQLVINSVFKPGHKWVVHVSTSRDILNHESHIKNIDNANVIIIEKSSQYKIYLKYKGDGIYSSDYYPPQLGKTYELVVEVPGYKTVKAQSIAPKKANIVNIIKDVVDEKVSKVNFEVKNDSNQYLIWNYISSNSKSGPIDTIFTGNPKSFAFGFFNYDNFLNGWSERGNDAISSEGIFSSNLVDDGGDGGKSNGSDTIIGDPDQSQEVEIKRYLRVVTASSNMYNYYKSVERFLSAINHNSSFSNSPQIYSNIENGLGVFAGYTEELTEIE